MTAEKNIECNNKSQLQMMITRINMSLEEKEKRRQKATDGMRRFRQAMSLKEIA